MSTPNTAPPSDPQTDEVTPIIIDLGKEKRGRIKDLKQGRGRLMDEVTLVVEEVRANLGADAEGARIIPIVVLYEKKRKKKKNDTQRGMRLPFMMC